MRDRLFRVSFLLFIFSGVVWWMIDLPRDFYRVANIHDLFDIIGAIATAIAAAYAAYGINQWRKQIPVTADHDLARKGAVIVEEYKDRLKRAFGTARFCFESVESGEVQGPNYEAVRAYAGQVMRDQKEGLTQKRAELDAFSVQCNALWGEEFTTSLYPVFAIEANCLSVLSAFMRVIDSKSGEKIKEDSSSRVLSCWMSLQTPALAKASSHEAYIDDGLKLCMSYLERKIRIS